MHHISRSQYYFEKIDQFLNGNSGNDILYLELYPNEIKRIQKQYPDLPLTKLGMVKSYSDDKRYHVLVRKISM